MHIYLLYHPHPALTPEREGRVGVIRNRKDV